MKITKPDFLQLLPQFMRDDANSEAFAYAIQSKLTEVALNIEHANLYARINVLSEAILDELAWQFNITEYRNDYDIAVKREIIKGCMALHYKRGTVGSVEEAVRKIFGDAEIEEWFNYGGKPYHFRIRTSNASATDAMVQEITKIVKETQSIRSHLEEVIVEIIQSMNLHVGCRVFIMDDVSLRTTET